MKVSIYSRAEINRIIKQGLFPDNAAVITFYDTTKDEDYRHVNYDNVTTNVFYCALDDVDNEYLIEQGKLYEDFFDYADDVAEFIYEAYDSGNDIICQCDYGQSRSAGCAAAILQHFYRTGIDVFEDYKRYPNKVIYHKIFDALESYKSRRK
ncbi:MAG: hypothetical protein ACI4YB_04745 [Oscillospiraceae bacterium]